MARSSPPTPPTHGEIAVLEVEGELDVHTAPAVREQVSAALEAGVTGLVLDLARTTFVDSSGIGVILDALKRLRAAGGGVAVVCATPNVQRVLELTGVDQLLPVVAARADALAAVR